MGRHDARAHYLHIPKAQKFKQQAPAMGTHGQQSAPQKPKQGTTAQNQFKRNYFS